MTFSTGDLLVARFDFPIRDEAEMETWIREGDRLLVIGSRPGNLRSELDLRVVTSLGRIGWVFDGCVRREEG